MAAIQGSLKLDQMLPQVAGDLLATLVLRTFIEASALLRGFQWANTTGKPGLHTTEETDDPQPQIRALNEPFSTSHGGWSPGFIAHSIVGNDIQHDRAARAQGMANPTAQTRRTIKSIGRRVEAEAVWGDRAVDPKGMLGMAFWARAQGMEFPADDDNTTDGGAALPLPLLDNVIDEVEDPAFIYTSSAIRNRITHGRHGIVVLDKDDYGKRIYDYNGIPIVTAGFDSQKKKILGFNEASGGPTPTAGSLYVFRHGDRDGFHPFLCGLPNADPIMTHDGPMEKRTHEVICGFACQGARAIARIHNIGDLPVLK